MIKTGAIAIAVMIIVPNVTASYSGYDINYQILGRQIYGIPLVCTVEFEDPNLPKSSIEKMMDEARLAILEWKSQLQRTERYIKDQEKWNIDYTPVSLSEKNNFDFSKCNVIIEFEPIPKNPKDHFAYIGLTESTSDFKSKITVFYTAIVVCTSKDSNFIYYKPCYSNKAMPFTQIASTLRHEFGHAIGLGHYSSTDDQNSKWASGKATAPSIMIVFAHDNPKKNPITVLDVETVLKLYGENGFLFNGEIKPEMISSQDENKIPNWIRDDAKWWAEGTVLDKDFIPTIKYLINHKIIQITNTNRSETGVIHDIPDWIKNTVDWWSKELISDDEFLNAIQYLVEQGIIKI